MYKKIEDVVAKLADAGYCAPHVVQVNKGSKDNPRWLDVVEWHEVVAMLDEVFGPFGWDAIPVNSTSDYANGLYTYDLMLVGRAVADDGGVVELKRPGRGVGLVPRSALNSDAEHDRQAHGAKSDAITNASKALGKGFGLYLYFKRDGAASQPSQRGATTVTPQSQSGDKRPSEKQLPYLLKAGYSQQQVDGMSFKEWKGCLDAIFGKQPLPIEPDGGKAAAAAPKAAPKKSAKAAAKDADDEEFWNAV